MHISSLPQHCWREIVQHLPAEKSEELEAGDCVKLLAGQHIAGPDGQEMCHKGDVGVVSRTPSGGSVCVAWERTGQTVSFSQELWREQFCRVSKAKGNIDVGIQVCTLAGQSFTGADGTLHYGGHDQGVVARIALKKITVAWTRSGKRTVFPKASWREHVAIIVGALSMLPIIGDKVRALQGQSYTNESGVEVFAERDVGFISRSEQELIFVVWERTGLVCCLPRDAVLEFV